MVRRDRHAAALSRIDRAGRTRQQEARHGQADERPEPEHVARRAVSQCAILAQGATVSARRPVRRRHDRHGNGTPVTARSEIAWQRRPSRQILSLYGRLATTAAKLSAHP